MLISGLTSSATVYLRVSDTAGNSTDATTQVVTIDTTAPIEPTIAGLVTNDTSPTLTGTTGTESGLPSDETMKLVVAGATYDVFVWNNNTWSLDLETAEPSSGTLGTLSNGNSYTVVLTVTDAADNVRTVNRTLIIDTVAPTTTLTIDSIDEDTGSSPSDFITKDDDGLTISATLSAALASDEKLEYSTDNSTWVDISTAVSETSVSYADSGLKSSATVYLRVSDTAGNSTDATTQVVTIDTTAPIEPTIAGLVTNDTSPTLTGTTGTESGLPSDETMNLVVAGATYDVFVWNNNTWSLDLETAEPSSGTLGTLSNGNSYTVVLTVTDAADNVRTVNRTLMIDTVAPTTTLTIDSIAEDTGSSSSDFITKDDDGLTISATLSAALASDEKLEYSTDNSTWVDISTAVSETSVSYF